MRYALAFVLPVCTTLSASAQTKVTISFGPGSAWIRELGVIKGTVSAERLMAKQHGRENR